MKKKIITFIISIIWLLFIGVNVFAQEETPTETKTWGDTILEYVPTIVEGIIAFSATIFAIKLNSKNITISLDDLKGAKNNFNTVTNAIKELTEKLEKYNDEFEKYSKKLEYVEKQQVKIINTLKTMATNNKELVENGSSMQITKDLEGDE